MDKVILAFWNNQICNLFIAICQSINVLNELLKNNKRIVVTDIEGYLKKISGPLDYSKSIINLKCNNTFLRDELISNLYDLGYSKESLVTKTGEFAVRGFVIDVFVSNMEMPIRIEFFGDDISSIRLFDVDSQKSIKEMDEVFIYPNKDDFGNESTLIDYFDNPKINFEEESDEIGRMIIGQNESLLIDGNNPNEEIRNSKLVYDSNSVGYAIFATETYLLYPNNTKVFINVHEKILFQFCQNLITGTESYKEKIKSEFFDKYKEKCSYESATSFYHDYYNNQYYVYICNNSIFEHKNEFPSLKFYHSELNYTFELTFDDFF